MRSSEHRKRATADADEEEEEGGLTKRSKDDLATKDVSVVAVAAVALCLKPRHKKRSHRSARCHKNTDFTIDRDAQCVYTLFLNVR